MEFIFPFSPKLNQVNRYSERCISRNYEKLTKNVPPKVAKLLQENNVLELLRKYLLGIGGQDINDVGRLLNLYSDKGFYESIESFTPSTRIPLKLAVSLTPGIRLNDIQKTSGNVVNDFLIGLSPMVTQWFLGEIAKKDKDNPNLKVMDAKRGDSAEFFLTPFGIFHVLGGCVAYRVQNDFSKQKIANFSGHMIKLGGKVYYIIEYMDGMRVITSASEAFGRDIYWRGSDKHLYHITKLDSRTNDCIAYDTGQYDFNADLLSYSSLGEKYAHPRDYKRHDYIIDGDGNPIVQAIVKKPTMVQIDIPG